MCVTKNIKGLEFYYIEEKFDTWSCEPPLLYYEGVNVIFFTNIYEPFHHSEKIAIWYVKIKPGHAHIIADENPVTRGNSPSPAITDNCHW